LAEGGAIGTVSHEFFHAWNVERIRPQSLEPFNFEQANMSGELWFAEGFTSYYTDLILCRAEVKTVEEYVDGLNKAFNYVWNSPGRKFFNPIEMSYQAPFVDAATSVDPVNRDNTFISYYSYGSVLGLALDLLLRNNYQQLNLDDYMKLVWRKYGKNEIPYTLANLHESLNEYAGKEFGDNFFNNYIYDSKMPKYFDLLADVGLNLSRVNKTSFFGAKVTDGVIDGEPTMNSPAYKAGLDSGDKIIAVNGKKLNEKITFDSLQEKLTRTDQMILVINRFGNEKIVKVSLGKDPKYTIKTYESMGTELTEYMIKTRNSWLNKK
jgi:predicted metalloprotease with PDZ domain